MNHNPFRAAAHQLTRALAALVLIILTIPAHATTITRVTSASGIEAWLVHDTTVPIIAMTFAFKGGATQDAAGKEGTANMVSQLLDEGAGDIPAKAFQERLASRAIEMSFRDGMDYFYGSLRTLSENRDEAATLLRLALSAPRFDDEAVARIRQQTEAGIRRNSTSPTALASLNWWQAAYPDHPYGRPSDGTLDSVAHIEISDLKAFAARTFARDTLRVVVVGDITANDLRVMLDQIFDALPAKSTIASIPSATLASQSEPRSIALNVPQTVISYGGVGLARNDPDFMTAYIVNHILGGGTFSSRLYREVREKRGLAYSVSQSLAWFEKGAVFLGGTATRADRAAETLALIKQEIQRMAKDGPTQQELDEAKSYLKGSQMLALDTSTKLASQLLQYQLDNLGIDYLEKRNAMFDAVTLANAKRVAKRLFGDGLVVTIVGPPAAPASQTPAK